MYQVITYRSRELKVNKIPLTGEEVSSPTSDNKDDEKLTFKEKRALKKELKKAKQAEFAKLSGMDEYTEDDFNPEEVEDMRVASILNNDSFYDALEPIDLNEPKNKKTQDPKKILLVAGVVLLMFAVSIISIIFMVGNI